MPILLEEVPVSSYICNSPDNSAEELSYFLNNGILAAVVSVLGAATVATGIPTFVTSQTYAERKFVIFFLNSIWKL
jgi:hypothetical protein